MPARACPSHVALLVPSVRRAVEALAPYGFDIGPEEDFEETREVYIQGHLPNPLLLMEPTASGRYRRALEKRGPGLHHFAIDVLDVHEFLMSLDGSGWLLQINSLKTFQKHRTVYLARPGFPGLIEVQEKPKLVDGRLFVSKVLLPLNDLNLTMIRSVGLQDLVKTAPGGPGRLALGGHLIELNRLWA